MGTANHNVIFKSALALLLSVLAIHCSRPVSLRHGATDEQVQDVTRQSDAKSQTDCELTENSAGKIPDPIMGTNLGMLGTECRPKDEDKFPPKGYLTADCSVVKQAGGISEYALSCLYDDLSLPKKALRLPKSTTTIATNSFAVTGLNISGVKTKDCRTVFDGMPTSTLCFFEATDKKAFAQGLQFTVNIVVASTEAGYTANLVGRARTGLMIDSEALGPQSPANISVGDPVSGDMPGMNGYVTRSVMTGDGSIFSVYRTVKRVSFMETAELFMLKTYDSKGPVASTPVLLDSGNASWSSVNNPQAGADTFRLHSVSTDANGKIVVVYSTSHIVATSGEIAALKEVVFDPVSGVFQKREVLAGKWMLSNFQVNVSAENDVHVVWYDRTDSSINAIQRRSNGTWTDVAAVAQFSPAAVQNGGIGFHLSRALAPEGSPAFVFEQNEPFSVLGYYISQSTRSWAPLPPLLPDEGAGCTGINISSFGHPWFAVAGTAAGKMYLLYPMGTPGSSTLCDLMVATVDTQTGKVQTRRKIDSRDKNTIGADLARFIVPEEGGMWEFSLQANSDDPASYIYVPDSISSPIVAGTIPDFNRNNDLGPVVGSTMAAAGTTAIFAAAVPRRVIDVSTGSTEKELTLYAKYSDQPDPQKLALKFDAKGDVEVLPSQTFRSVVDGKKVIVHLFPYLQIGTLNPAETYPDTTIRSLRILSYPTP